MWGCIGVIVCHEVKRAVPSLYVRVYHFEPLPLTFAPRSLIICEGVSARFHRSRQKGAFPHYMWGCIVLKSWSQPFSLVPSLYVRVYRLLHIAKCSRLGSLIICEGVSFWIYVKGRRALFPHYMWGCIANALQNEINKLVPSLYVRVYRRTLCTRIMKRGSLIICEGVSCWRGSLGVLWMFPHYMWGCITYIQGTWRTKSVPSLYVRVYRRIM